jgi:pimeloyl-ACP methyl ester carboxylesterase
MNDTTSTLEHVTSKDGTKIAFDRLGSGPPVVLVSGGSVDRGSNAPLAGVLASDFTVFNYDRRGRGPSGDTQPYAPQREFEDIEAVIGAAGGPVGLYGSSSGAALALEATASGVPVSKLALWEPPYFVGDNPRRPAPDTASIYRKFVSEGRRGDAAEYFMTKVVGMPAEFVAFAKSQPWWPAQEALAHTLAYDAEIMGNYDIPFERISKVSVPTLVLTGGESFDFMVEAAQAIVDALPNAGRQAIEGQSHDISADALGPVLKEFFAG